MSNLGETKTAETPKKNTAAKKQPAKKTAKTPTKRPRGRPKTKDDNADALKVISDVAAGKSTRQAITDNKMRRETFYQLQSQSEDLRSQYTRAKEGQALHYADKLLEIAQDVLDGVLDPQAARAAADIIKWTAARILPNTYSERKTIDVNVANTSDPAAHLLARAKALSEADVIDVS